MKLDDAVRGNQLQEAVGELVSWVSRDARAALVHLTRKELLIGPRSPAFRARLREGLLSAVTAADPTGVLLREALPYLAYCDIVAVLRDEVALRANNDAQLLAGLPEDDAIELAAAIVQGQVRRYVQEHRPAEERTEASTPTPTVPGDLVRVFWEIAGIYELLPAMLLEIASARNQGQARKPLSLLHAARAAQRLFRTAEDWQRLSDIRQRVAAGRDRISRVERNFVIFVEPASITAECHSLVARRRHALSGVQSQDMVEPFRAALLPFVEPVVRFVSSAIEPVRADQLLEETLGSLAQEFRPSDVILVELFEWKGAAGRAARCYFTGFLVSHALAHSVRSLGRGKRRYLQEWNTDDLVGFIGHTALAPENHVRAALSQLSWDPATETRRTHLDLATTPFMKSGERTRTLVLGGGHLSPFSETRRLLASTNRLSTVVGTAYERYVRFLVQEAGFAMAPGRVTIRAKGRAVTDADVVGYKDGLVVIVQAKHMVEPDSHHARWKAEQELRIAIRQCVQVRDAFRREPERVVALFPSARANAPLELLCLVVTPVVDFSGVLAWPVTIVDDAYLEHVVHVGAVRTLSMGGKVVASTPMYEGQKPTGQEFRDLMLHPEFMRYYRGSDLTVGSERTTVRNTTFVRFPPLDSIS